MEVIPSSSIAFQPVTTEGACGAFIKELITDRDGAPTFAMRLFEIAPGGNTPLHQHPWEHEVFILSGQGELRGQNESHPFREGDAVFVPPDELHTFVNTGEQPLRLLCMIPVQQPCCR